MNDHNIRDTFSRLVMPIVVVPIVCRCLLHCVGLAKLFSVGHCINNVLVYILNWIDDAKLDVLIFMVVPTAGLMPMPTFLQFSLGQCINEVPV